MDDPPEPSASSRLLAVACRYLLLVIGFGIIPIDSLVGRLPRDAWKHVRIADLYQDMERAWPTLSPDVRDHFYLANFRVDESTFERIFVEVQVSLSSSAVACMSMWLNDEVMCWYICWYIFYGSVPD